MPKVLITGFEPFDGFTVNSSEEVVKRFHKTRVNGFSTVGIVLPLDYTKALGILDEAVENHNPDYVLCCGQANRAAISIERMGVNVISTTRVDNYENLPESDIINTEGPAAFFANLDPIPLVQALLDNGIPAFVSYHAGHYGCNWLLYKVMERIENGALDAKATFIHLPPLPSQAIEKDQMSLPTMSLEMQIKAMFTIIKSIG